MLIKGAFALFMSLAIGYVLCILANKQKKGILQTLGYTLGASIIVMSLVYSLADSCSMKCGKDKMWGGNKGMKCHGGMFMKGKIK
ncbi:MAG: hypothetical protein NT036_03320 [Candidatus Omnitrophica bacterium]|nr:hypothetical protein [Candidatus Omnitrophota bacterium]